MKTLTLLILSCGLLHASPAANTPAYVVPISCNSAFGNGVFSFQIVDHGLGLPTMTVYNKTGPVENNFAYNDGYALAISGDLK